MQYIKEAAAVDIAPRLQRIIDKCIQPEMQERYADVDEVLKAVTKNRKWMLRIGIAMALLIALGTGITIFSKTDSYRVNNLRLGWLLSKPDHDIMYERNYFRILSEDSLTCIAVGGKRLENLYIHDRVYGKDGKEYRTVAVAEDAFGGRRIKSVYIPEGVKEIGVNAFCYCENILSLHLPSSVERIGNCCFEGLKSMKSLQLSGSIKEIPLKAFVKCSSLEKLVIPEGVEVLGLDAFAICTNLKEVSLPSTLTTISRGAFWHCTNLKEIVIPASVTTIGEYVFHECDSLTDVYCYAPVPLRIPPIYNKEGITLHVPRGSEELYRQADNWNVARVVGDL